MKRIPFECDFELTLECNLRCWHCYQRGAKKPGFMDIALAERAMDELKELGCLVIGLTGGEPVLHPQFWDIAAMARSKGFAVSLSTNGTLIGVQEADRMSVLPFSSVQISVHGATAQVHERLTGVAGSFEAARRAVCLCQERGVPATVKCALMRHNAHEASALAAFCGQLNCQLAFDPALTPSLDGALDIEQARITKEQIADIADLLMPDRPVGRGPRRCSAGLSRLAISSDGTVYPCVTLRRPCGKLPETGLAAIWHQSPSLLALREQDGVSSESCRKCSVAHFCSGCPMSSAMQINGEAEACRVARVLSRVSPLAAVR